MPVDTLSPNELCCAPIDLFRFSGGQIATRNEWCRARFLQITGAMAKVFLVDYGIYAAIDKGSIWRLPHSAFVLEHTMAIPCTVNLSLSSSSSAVVVVVIVLCCRPLLLPSSSSSGVVVVLSSSSFCRRRRSVVVVVSCFAVVVVDRHRRHCLVLCVAVVVL